MTDITAWLAHVDDFLSRSELVAASRALAQWMQTHPGDPQAHLRLSRVLRLRGRQAEAQAILESLVSGAAAFAPALVDLGRLAQETGHPALAHTWYERAHLARPEAIDGLGEWIDVLFQLGQPGQARAVAERLCAGAPEHAANWFRLGLALQQQRAYHEALEAYSRAAQLDSRLPMLRNNAAALHIEMGNYADARCLLEETIRDEPVNALAWTNLGNVYLKSRDPDAGLIAAERACALAPDYPVALQTRSNVLKELQRWDDALGAAESAVRNAPGNPSYAWSLAIIQLLRGDYRQGWTSFEARWAGSPELREAAHNIARPQWRGEDLAGKTVFVWGEQGFGDALQFVRFVPQIAERVKRAGGTLIYCCFAELLPVFRRTMEIHAGTIVAHDQSPLPAFDYHLPLCSLPLALCLPDEDIGRDVPYLKADVAQTARWRHHLGTTGKLRVGLVWTGNRTHQRNPLRSVNITAYAEAFGSIPDIEFYNLQVNAPEEVTQARDAGLALVDHSGELRSFDDTAAFIGNLDLVITVCTSVAHLAGGLGVPTWVLLDVNPHWVWQLERADSPWYPATRLYRQERYGEWNPVLRRVAEDLRSLATHRESSAKHDNAADQLAG